MILIVTTPFVGTVGGVAYNMPAVGTRLDVTDEAGRALLGMGVAERMETKIDAVPLEVKKKPAPLESSQVDPVRRQPMRINSRPFVTK